VEDDKLKTRIASDNGWILIRLPYTLRTRVLVALRSHIAVHYPYIRDGKLYRSVDDLARSIEGKITGSQYDRLLKYNQYKTRLLDVE